ncbi:hypothetical protein BX666DRAFT_1969086 [Dichotomocladium elegans]|nr:hypothetical protein BX666DRAFT_1969086 [Dichotomocladium elegans]
MNPTDHPSSPQHARDKNPSHGNPPPNPYAFELHLPPQPSSQFGDGGPAAFSRPTAARDTVW